VIGKDVPLALLQFVADMPPEQLECEIAELRAAEFLYELNISSDIELTFRHALIQTVANQSGCGACHKFGEAGNATLGPDLTHIGAKLPAPAIARTLRNPTAPMPSYADLPPKKFNALVEYLAALR